MVVSLDLLNELYSQPPRLAWQTLLDYAWQICVVPLDPHRVGKQITQREREIYSADLLLATTCWDLWQEFEACVESTADALANWWQEGRQNQSGQAILILDGLSLREVPWILEGAQEQGLSVIQTRVTRSELPADTKSFAQALGLNQRADLQNNGASQSHRLFGATTDTVDLPWLDCISLIKAEPNWLLWHEWPDSALHHQFAKAGQGGINLAEAAAKKLKDPDFWALIKRLTTGRSLIITSDHGYAATGNFPDASPEHTEYLKPLFGQKRWAVNTDEEGVWVPPLDLVLKSQHGEYRYALGCRKWKSSGGYPTLTHGGLSLLEVAVPFIQLS